jgi:hypothetical protein
MPSSQTRTNGEGGIHFPAAHTTLTDSSLRRYDMGEDIDGQMNSEGGGFPGGVDISEMLFAQMFGGGAGGSPFGSAGGPFGGGGRPGHSHSHSQGFGF